MSKTVIITFANNKGGSGKTTTASNVGCALARAGKKVLLVDGDMQMNLTLSCFDEETTLGFLESGRNLYTAVKEEKDLSSFTVPTEFEGLDLIPSSTQMSQIEFDLFPKWQREFIFKKCLAAVAARGSYDYILVDAPPTLGAWVMNLLAASDFVIIPVEASPWGLFGLANMFEFLEKVKSLNPALSVLGIAVTKADERKTYFKQTLQTLRELGFARIFESVIRVDSTVEWAQDNSKPVVAYKKTSRAALEYVNLAKEIDTYAHR